MTLKIIGAGFGRTGTVSLKLALEQLGFGPCYHMFELLEDPSRTALWQQALKEGQTNWNDLLAGFQSTVDFPSYLFYQQLLEQNPDAKVILTERDAESWYESAFNTIFQGTPSVPQKMKILLQLPFNRQLRQMLPVFGLMDHYWDVVWEGRFGDKSYAIEKFLEHNRRVKEQVPAEQLLVFDVRDGWAPLCEFLQVPVPDSAFPRANRRAGFSDILKGIRNGKAPKAIAV